MRKILNNLKGDERMRKILNVFIGLLAAVTVFSCVACVGDTPAEEHNEHTFGEWSVTTPPTCTENGTETRVCSVCGAEDARSVVATGHTFGEWSVTAPPTCTENGTETRVCSVCGDKEEQTLAAVDHVYENGKCKWCALEDASIEKPKTDGEVKAGANYGGNGATDWEIDEANGVYKSKTAANANLTFTGWQFEGGVIEWDMTIAANAQYAFYTTCGITFASPNENIVGGNFEGDSYYCFGRAFTGEYVGYSKLNGAFQWQDYAKLSSINCGQGVKNHFKLEYDDVNNIIYLTYGDQSTFFVPTVKLKGKYFGLYSEAEGTIFENIKVVKKEYAASALRPMNQSKWKEEAVDGVTTYTALSDASVAVLNGVEFTTGSIEWDMTVPDGDFVFGVMCGLIWGAESDVINIYSSQYLCSGFFPSGVYVTFAKVFNGTSTDLKWENSAEIKDEGGTLMPRNVKVHYKFTYDGTNLTLEVGGKKAVLQPTVKPFGKTVALYSELAGTKFSNVTIKPLAA